MHHHRRFGKSDITRQRHCLVALRAWHFAADTLCQGGTHARLRQSGMNGKWTIMI